MTHKTRDDIRNVAIIAHVDHGKTTLVDGLLKQSNIFRANQAVGDLIMDSSDLEREKGITILAKNTAVMHRGIKINIIDTPGHADFSGEVERVLNMADGCLLLVDAVEGSVQMLVTTLDYDDYKGKFAIGRLMRGTLHKGDQVSLVRRDGTITKEKIALLFTYQGLKRIEVDVAEAGDIIAVTGMADAMIGDTIADAVEPQALPPIRIEEPTVKMTFGVNTSPFAGKDGHGSTWRQLRGRLVREL